MKMRCVGLLLTALGAVSAQPLPNAVTIQERSGSAQDNRPVTISRVFARGNITRFAQPRINEQPVSEFQCDVKNRWDDGSVRHALISFRVSLGSHASAATDFIDSENPCHLGDAAACEQGGLNAQQMLGSLDGGWDASIRTAVAGITNSAQARSMLEDGAWRYWLRGPVVTQIIVEDRSPSLRYDWGYKDQRLLVTTDRSISATTTTFSVFDSSSLASLPLPARVRLNTEELSICAVNGNTLSIGKSSCPNVDGRGTNGTKAAGHGISSVVQLLDINAPAGWQERVVAYTPFNFSRGFAANVTSLTVSSAELLQALPVPFLIQIDSEQISVCAIAGNTVRFGLNTTACPNIDGRGANGTRAAAHRDNRPIYAPSWHSQWVAAPSAEYKSLHPVFVATFYSGWPGIKIESILENTWTTKQQDQSYALTLLSGAGLGRTRESFPKTHHRAGTRWRRTYWEGEAPGAIHIDHNFPYLIQSKAVPNFDLSRTVSAKAIEEDVSRYAQGDKDDINSTGMLLPAFPNTGGRPDIGLFTLWDVRYLYSANPNLYDVVIGNASVSGNVPIHFRESDDSRPFDMQASVPAFGRPTSTYARPKFVSRSAELGAQPDRLTPVGLTSNLVRQSAAGRRLDNWAVDVAHQPSIVYLPYLLTGDWYFLEELYFWAQYNLLSSTDGTCDFCRHDEWGILNEANVETRGLAWGLRTIAHAAFMAPESDPEKPYMMQRIDYNIAVREGVLDIRDGLFYDPDPNSPWSWGRNVVARGVANPLRFPHRLLGAFYSTPPATGHKACAIEGPWQLGYNYVVWGHMEELGFAAIAAVKREGLKNLLQRIVDPTFTPKDLLAAYYLPTRGVAAACVNSTALTSWTEIIAAADPVEIPNARVRWSRGASDPDGGYPTIALGAASFLPSIDPVSGLEAWTWMKNNVTNQQFLNDNPKWAFLPRSSAGNPPVSAKAGYVPLFKKKGPLPRPLTRGFTAK